MSSCVGARDESREDAPADGERGAVLDLEVGAVMTVVVAPEVEEGALAAVCLDAADEHGTVFAADLGVHVGDERHAFGVAGGGLTSSTASSSPL